MKNEQNKPQNCGTCRWLDAPAENRRKDGVVKDRYRFRVYNCTVPLAAPNFPACIPQVRLERQMMCPYYGMGCVLHEPYSRMTF